MALDHYVSQVHLKRFYSPSLGGRMFAIRKSDLKAFTPDAASICRIPEGSTNSYLQEPRAVEEFLRGVEPRYNEAISRLESNSLDKESVYAIAGFVAYVATCSPAAMRIHSGPLRAVVEETGRRMDARGENPDSPESLGGESITSLIDSGKVTVTIDGKYPQAIGIAQILRLTAKTGNSMWEVLMNEHEDSPYFTSDYPIAIEATSNPMVINRVVPLTPRLALRIRPDLSREEQGFDFPSLRLRFRKIARAEAVRVNTLIARCAEDLILFRDDLPWVKGFVRKNSSYQVDTVNTRFPAPRGTLLWSSMRIVERKARPLSP